MFNSKNKLSDKQFALKMAVELHKGNLSFGSDIVSTAKDFYKFLKSKHKISKSLT